MADNSTYAPSTVGSLVKGTYSMACTPNLPSNDLRSGSEIGVYPYLKPKWYDMGTLPTLPPLTCCMLLQHECFIRKLHRTTHLQQSALSSSLLSICMAATVRSEIRFCPCILHKHYSSKRCYDASGEPSRRQSHDQEALSLWSLCTLQCHPILAVAIHGSWVSQHRSSVQCSSTLQ